MRTLPYIPTLCFPECLRVRQLPILLHMATIRSRAILLYMCFCSGFPFAEENSEYITISL